ncbi:UTP--glucose-1-phosphate uridylyltransferase GalU [Mollicutes bacterium LVI A0078]|nr:UTP--glucose-1-phosphate uridylyltransferase GalU [Mollicutes bacterium LVI A0075]WOO91474.1 UTP--glucose-1-phosphate uridylyltransferase GalU [Mollicutes bacterium LVI A0078]
MKKITKAVIPVAGFGTRFLPFTKAMPKEMLPLIDKPTIQYIVEEAVKAGITDILIVTASHSNKRAIEDHFDSSKLLEYTLEKSGKFEYLELVKGISEMANIHYIRQHEARGLGDAILCAKSFMGDDPFAIILGDDVVINDSPAIGQLITAYEQTGCSQMGVQEVEHSQVYKYGIVKCAGNSTVELMTDFVEKPAIEDAPSNKAVLARYIVTPTIFKYLENQAPGAGNEVQLTDAVKRMMAEEDVYACTFEGKRYDIGDKVGFLKATVDFALEREDLREEFSEYLKSKINEL